MNYLGNYIRVGTNLVIPKRCVWKNPVNYCKYYNNRKHKRCNI